jgi:subtilisin-like proprotein convertase family protein
VRKTCFRTALLLLILLITSTTPGFAEDEDPPPDLTGQATDLWVVILEPGTSPTSITQLGFEYLGPVDFMPYTHVFRKAGTGAIATGEAGPEMMGAASATRTAAAAADAAGALGSARGVARFEQQVALPVELRQPSDPGLANQWHLINTGQAGGTAGEDINVEPAWDAGYTGAGITIGIIDEGAELTHPDLFPNYNAALSYDYADSDADPSPVFNWESHGTAIAGLAAAAADTAAGSCGVGSAYGAALAILRIGFVPFTDLVAASALSHNPNDIDIYNASWGPTDDGATLQGPGTLTTAAIQNGIASGRGGLGSIYVWSSGNGALASDNINADGYANWRYTIAVGGTDNNGELAYLVEPGAPMLVNASATRTGAGIVTADRTGALGFSPTDCTDSTWTLGGTSAPAPIVSGVVALMLQANPGLDWRDVQHVLVETAEQNDSTDADWQTNLAGYTANHNYGHGRVDAGAATTLAVGWDTVPTETSLSSGVSAPGATIPDGGTLNLSASFSDPNTENLVIEYATLTLDITHPLRSDISVRLIAPGGKVSQLMTVRPNDANADFPNWTFSSVHHWAESSLGTWNIEITDNAGGNVGTLDSWELVFYGFPALANDTFAEATDIGDLAAPFTDTARTIQTTTGIDDPAPSCGSGGQAHRTAWYQYTPAEDGTVTFDTEGSDYDTVLSVWTGTPGSLTEAGCNNDSGGGGTSSLELDLSAGTTYYVLVSGFDMDFGNLIFNAGLPSQSGGGGSGGAADIGYFDPGISKLGLLAAGELGITGEQVQWIITVSNNGTGTGYGIAVTDTLRNELRIDRVEIPDWLTYTIDGQTVTVSIPALDPGRSVQFSIFSTVLVGGARIENTACIGNVCADGWIVTELPETGE